LYDHPRGRGCLRQSLRTFMVDAAPADGFEWVPAGWGQVLRAPGLFEAADHFFTTRQLRLRGPVVEEREWGLVASAIGVAPERLFRPKQVHGRAVVVVSGSGGAAGFSAGRRPRADAVLTDDPACALAVQVADCVPILIADRRTGAVAAVHAGWRGSAAAVVGAATAGLVAAFGSRPADLVAALGPSIGPCCYEVGPEVRDAFLAAGHDNASVARWFERRPDGRFLLDLWTTTRDQLLAAGLQAGHVHAVRLCTAHEIGRFHSYRAEGPGTGRLAAVIRARG
jgi:purine-nucleoside/S-methyl-5'-thioadenosine phosphorylase / adenosine deaminase